MGGDGTVSLLTAGRGWDGQVESGQRTASPPRPLQDTLPQYCVYIAPHIPASTLQVPRNCGDGAMAKGKVKGRACGQGGETPTLALRLPSIAIVLPPSYCTASQLPALLCIPQPPAVQ